MNSITRSTLLAAAAAAALVPQAFAASASDFVPLNYYHVDGSGSSTLALPGQLYVPTNYNPSQSYPLVLFLHGRGEAGTNNTSQINSSIDNLLAAAKSRNFFLYAPQSENTISCWQTVNTAEADDLRMALRQVQSITTQYNINASKMYVTGLSYGGSGTWNVIGAYRDNFAAAVPIVAAGAYQPMSWLAGKPIWSYEARDDQFCFSVGRPAVNAMDVANGVPQYNFATTDTLIYNGSSYYTNSSDLYYAGGSGNQRYTEYATGGHTIATWGRAYGEAPMYDWLLNQSHAPHVFQAGETIRMDFGGTATTISNGVGTTTDSQGRVWNSDTKYQEQLTVGVSLPFCMNTAGVRTPVTASVVTPFYGAIQRTGTVATLYDTTVTQDSWLSNAAHQGQIRVSGLTPGAIYNVMIFASDTDSDGTNGRLTRYTLQDASGSQIRDLNIVNNVSAEAAFTVTADSSGTFLLTVSPTGTARYAEISSLTITAVPEPASLGLLALSLGWLQRRRRAQRP